MKIFGRSKITGERLYRFTPQSDISAYELAMILKNLRTLQGSIADTPDRPIPVAYRRHFEEVVSS